MSRWLSVLLAVLCAVPVCAQSGRLQSVRERVDRPDKKDEKSRDKDDKDEDDERDRSDSDSDSDSGVFAEIIGFTLLAPFALPHAAVNDDLHRSGYFPYYPYQQGRPGYLRIPYVENEEPKPLRTFAGRVSFEYGNDFNDVERFGTRLMLDTTSRFGLQANHDFFRETLYCGCTDEFDLGAVSLTYRFAQHAHLQMHTGLGMNVLDDGRKTHYGFNFLYGAEIYPVKPVILGLQMDAGSVGDAGLFRLRGMVGVNWKRIEVFTGYDYLNIGGVDLQGLLGGVRLWW